MKYKKTNHRLGTNVVHVGQEPDPSTGAVVPPIYMTSTYKQEGVNKHKGFDYGRTRNPNRDNLEQCIACLEDAKYGLAYSSGMAALDNVIQSLLCKDSYMLVCDDVYGGTFRLLDKSFKKWGLVFDFIDMSNLELVDEKLWLNQYKNNITLMESPTNPLLKIIDINEISRIAAKYSSIVVVDNTFATPYFQKPLNLGADVVVHSTTKYINGHSTVIGGAVALNRKDLYNEFEDYRELKFNQNALGAIPSPFDCWLMRENIKTFPLRMEKHQANAFKIAEFLSSHPKIEKVIYPGLNSHPQHELAKKQMYGFGGMVSFDIGSFRAADKFLKKIKLFTLAESLGGVESLIEHPAKMTHASIPREIREKNGITDGLIRASVGIEDAEDLIEDLERALNS